MRKPLFLLDIDEFNKPLRPRKKPRRKNREAHTKVAPIESKARRIAGRPVRPPKDGDNDGFVTNPVTNRDDMPAPPQLTPRSVADRFRQGPNTKPTRLRSPGQWRSSADGVDDFNERYRAKYGEDAPEDGDGDCYEAASNLAIKLWAEADPADRDRIKLVHGVPLGQGPIEGIRFGHAWVEVDDSPTEEELAEQLADQPESIRQQMMQLARGMNIVVMDHSNGQQRQFPRSMYYAIGNIEPSDTRYYSMTEVMANHTRFGHYGPWE